MDWKPEEDIVCCEICVYEYVIKKNATDINSCIRENKVTLIYLAKGFWLNQKQDSKYKSISWRVESREHNPDCSTFKCGRTDKKILITCLKNAGYLKSSAGNV